MIQSSLDYADFKEGDFVVYPAHGVGRLVKFEVYEVDGVKAELMVITFDRDRMTLRLPPNKAKSFGLRPLSSKEHMNLALESLKHKMKARRTMWSRRAQEYEAKINSGDLNAIAEVLRELHRSPSQSDQSYSERQIYQSALERLARELAAVESIGEHTAIERLGEFLGAA